MRRARKRNKNGSPVSLIRASAEADSAAVVSDCVHRSQGQRAEMLPDLYANETCMRDVITASLRLFGCLLQSSNKTVVSRFTRASWQFKNGKSEAKGKDLTGPDELSFFRLKAEERISLPLNMIRYICDRYRAG